MLETASDPTIGRRTPVIEDPLIFLQSESSKYSPSNRGFALFILAFLTLFVKIILSPFISHYQTTKLSHTAISTSSAVHSVRQ